jgi:hypothetical protein
MPLSPGDDASAPALWTFCAPSPLAVPRAFENLAPAINSWSLPIRRSLDHFIILSEAHLRRLLRTYVTYYDTVRPHQALANNSPQPREVQPPSHGRITTIPHIGGLHHRDQRVA